MTKNARSKRYPAKTIIDTENADEIPFPVNTPAQTESLSHRLEQTAEGIGLLMNANKTEYMCFKREGANPALSGRPLKFIDKFTYLGSSVSSTESDINMRLLKVWTIIDGQSIIWKFDLSDKIKWDFFQTVAVSILLNGCITWTLTKCIKKKLDVNNTRILRAILNKSWKERPTK